MENNREVPNLVDQNEAAGRLVITTPAELSERAREKAATGRVLTAMRTRRKDRAAEPTGVRLVSPLTGNVQEIYNDGSIRNQWKRREGLSGRQFRKLRKKVNKLARKHAVQGALPPEEQ